VRRRGEEAGIKGLHPHMFRPTPLPIAGAPRAATRPTSCVSPAGTPRRCSATTQLRPPTLAPVRPIAASPRWIASRGMRPPDVAHQPGTVHVISRCEDGARSSSSSLPIRQRAAAEAQPDVVRRHLVEHEPRPTDRRLRRPAHCRGQSARDVHRCLDRVVARHLLKLERYDHSTLSCWASAEQTATRRAGPSPGNRDDQPSSQSKRRHQVREGGAGQQVAKGPC
jgi:hypothetical protein